MRAHTPKRQANVAHAETLTSLNFDVLSYIGSHVLRTCGVRSLLSYLTALRFAKTESDAITKQAFLFAPERVVDLCLVLHLVEDMGLNPAFFGFVPHPLVAKEITTIRYNGNWRRAIPWGSMKRVSTGRDQEKKELFHSRMNTRRRVLHAIHVIFLRCQVLGVHCLPSLVMAETCPPDIITRILQWCIPFNPQNTAAFTGPETVQWIEVMTEFEFFRVDEDTMRFLYYLYDAEDKHIDFTEKRDHADAIACAMRRRMDIEEEKKDEFCSLYTLIAPTTVTK